MAQVIHFVRHGEVHNPEKILYGLQPGWKLSERGNQMAEVIAQWSKSLNLGAIHASQLHQ
jgi:broad specificity phosphatase PhoE